MNRLCELIGHRWKGWQPKYPDSIQEMRICIRCNRGYAIND
jgi:hypothetical protein